MIYYHGTKSAIHLSDKPYLDVERSIRGDGIIKKDHYDPEIPHVYVTDTKLKATLFSLPAPQPQITCGCYDNGQGFAVYAEKPVFDGPCHLYTLRDEDMPGGLEERAKGRFVSYCNIPLSPKHHSLVPIEDILSNARIFFLDSKTDLTSFSDAIRGMPGQGWNAMMQFMEKMKTNGIAYEYGTGVKNLLKPLQKDQTFKA